MRLQRRILLLPLLLLLAVPAWAGQKQALVIGNGGYAEGRLQNPANDARDIAAKLRSLDFKVTELIDAGQRQMENAVRDFTRALGKEGVGLFYFAGHGIEVGGENYLIPLGADIQSEVDVRYKALSAGYVLESMRAAGNPMNLVILDACRNNPYARSFRSGGSRGLARMSAAKGSLVLYATQPGEVAQDGSGRNGLFTEKLLAALDQPGLKAEEVFKQTALAVDTASGRQQTPWQEGVILGDFYFREPAQKPDDPLEQERLALIRERENLAAERQRLQSEAAQSKPKPPEPPSSEGKGYREPKSGMEFVRIEGGSFPMGSPAGEKDRDEDERQHRVSVGDFYLAKHEVTVSQFRRFVEAAGYRTDAEKDAGGRKGCYSEKPGESKWDWVAGRHWKDPGYKQGDDHPVACVSWNDAMAYAGWLSQETGKKYRLPSEAEWEYAARAGTETARFWGNDPDQACRYANGADQTIHEGQSWTTPHNCNDGYWFTAPVGNYSANAFGLHDMLGNVWEWTCSAYDKDYGGSEKQCSSKNDATVGRVRRGGSWGDGPGFVRSADRGRFGPAGRGDNAGFRLARIISP